MNAEQKLEQVLSAVRAALPSWVPRRIFDAYVRNNRPALLARLQQVSSGACDPQPRDQCGGACSLRLTLPGSYCAGEAALMLPSANGPRSVPARYCLTSAQNLIASHDPMTWIPRPEYPPNTQERRYESDPAEQMKIVQISERIRPEVIFSTTAGALEGPPVVTVGGLVAGGNGRTMGIQRAYLIGRGDAIRCFLRRNAPIFGFRPSDVDRYQDPILVRVVEVKDADLPRLVRDLNQSTTQSMDAVAEAVSLARVMPPAALDAIANGLGEDEDLSEFLGSARSKPMISALVEAGIITSANRNRLLERTGLLSEDGRRLVVAQLAAALVQDAATLEDLGQIRQSLARSAPWWLAASATRGYDVRQAFTKAAKDLLDVRRADLTLAQWRRQSGLFGVPHTDGDPLAQMALSLLDAAGAKPVVLTRVAKRYRQLASALGAAPILLPADELDQMAVDAQASGVLPRPEDALQAAARAAGVRL